MKKLIAFTGLLLLTATPSFAATLAFSAAQAGYNLQATAPATTIIAKTSKGVRIGANYTATGYSLNTEHTQGSKEYGTAYDATAIYVREIGTNTFGAPSSSVAAEAFPTSGGWSAL